jgi:hypothetical protein
MAIGSAFFAQLDFEDIEDGSLSSVWIARLVNGEAAGSSSANETNPAFCKETDSRHTAMLMFVRVGEANDPVEAHGVLLALLKVN